MTIIRQHRVYRRDLRANPSVLYLFGDNEQRVGLGGQAGEMRGEPNAVGIRTKASPGGSEEFWNDARFAECKQMIDDDLKPIFLHVMQEEIVVIPLDGLGTGLSKLPEVAPKIFKYLSDRVAVLASL